MFLVQYFVAFYFSVIPIQCIHNTTMKIGNYFKIVIYRL